MMDHLGFPVADLMRTVGFYTGVFGPLGLHEVTRFPIPGGTLVGLAYADDKPFLWFSADADTPDGESAGGGGEDGGGVSQELHLALLAPDAVAVDQVHAAAVEFGVEVLHAPRVWPEYHPGYYAVFLRDPDGHNVEAVTHSAAPIS